jgi:hypothetical protein
MNLVAANGRNVEKKRQFIKVMSHTTWFRLNPFVLTLGISRNISAKIVPILVI